MASAQEILAQLAGDAEEAVEQLRRSPAFCKLRAHLRADDKRFVVSMFTYTKEDLLYDLEALARLWLDDGTDDETTGAAAEVMLTALETFALDEGEQDDAHVSDYTPELLARRVAYHMSTLRNQPSKVMGKVFVNRDDTLIIYPRKPQTDIELPRLRSILQHASRDANYIGVFLKDQRIAGQVSRSSLRKALTIRDSLGQMARLLNGEDLDNEIVNSVSDEGKFDLFQDEIEGEVLSPAQAQLVEAARRIPSEGQQIRSAYAYQVMKRVKARIGVVDKTVDRDALQKDLGHAMLVLTGQEPVPTNGDKE